MAKGLDAIEGSVVVGRELVPARRSPLTLPSCPVSGEGWAKKLALGWAVSRLGVRWPVGLVSSRRCRSGSAGQGPNREK